ncbi:uncharacterized protein ACLA_031680 [Aspergillus clavatus NRRL 1]|uniref:FAR-17a/AIG1-like protein n=1 Tax=Aspergillus clavatus (strain ATCC 1007 / CBS 513.65 / DSM 816 / NCTC 3887 / NRRL 1 / QM 1276 / 107) TaxID=344612 RepID=A1CS14_ASPCL|nr:uncharacterized protein ACLA_031680 [Aspergillus clavatus NRRL 1]EAW08435.1 conserved hypothetical protein [Aspergillus clavatus NRRL 1]
MKLSKSFSSLFGVDASLDHIHPFETSWLLSPLPFALLRGLIALYIFVTIFFIWGWSGSHGASHAIGQSFSYFTWLTYWGLGFYYLAACIHTACYARSGRSLLFDRLPRPLRALHALFYTTVTTFPFLVTIVFWGILFSPPWYKLTFSAWSNISQHGLNSLWALLEIILPTTNPHPLVAFPFLVLILLLYVSLAYLTFHTQGFYTYSFLDPGPHGEHKGLVAGYCFGIFAAILVIFGLSWCAIWLRRRLTGGRIKRSVYDKEEMVGRAEMAHVGV